MEHRIQGAYTALDMGALYKAYGRVLKTRVSLQNERRQLEMSGVNSVRGACPRPMERPTSHDADVLYQGWTLNKRHFIGAEGETAYTRR